MGVSLNGLTPATTYPGLLKTTDNIDLSVAEKTISDGLGNDTPLSLSTTKVNVNSDLHVGATLKLLLRDTVGGAEVRADVGDLFIGTNAAEPVDIYTDDTLRMRVTDTGLVGVGFPFAANPLHLFDVNGDARVIGHIYDSSNNQGTTGQVLVKTATGQEWQAPSGGIGGSGTANNITMWTGANTVGDMPNFRHTTVSSGGSTYDAIQFGNDDYLLTAVGPSGASAYDQSLSLGKDNFTGGGPWIGTDRSNIAIGWQRFGPVSINSAISIGNGASLDTATVNADNVIAIGTGTMGALDSTFNGQHAIAIGESAFALAESTHTNAIAIGNSAGYLSNGLLNGRGVMIGQSAGRESNTQQTIMIGVSAGYQTTNGDNSILIGTQAGQGSDVTNTIMMGLQNGLTHDAVDCIFIGGFSAGTQPAPTRSEECIVIGQYANLTGGSNEIVIGSGVTLSPVIGNGNNTTTIGSPATTDTYLEGDLHTGGIYDSVGGTLGTSGQVLSSTGTGTQWINVSGSGTVTSVDVSGGTTGLTTSGGPITGSGTITLAGTLAAANGGTGQNTYVQGEILYANVSGGLSKLAPGTAGQVLSTNGAGADPSWIAVGGTGTVTSVDVSGGTTGLTFTGGPVTTAGTITAGGTLGYANGGTGTTAANLAELQDHLGLKAAYAHTKWTGAVNPYFNFPAGSPVVVPFDEIATAGFQKGTATGITINFNSATDTTFTVNDDGIYKVTLRLHFYDQTSDLDVIGVLYDTATNTPVKGLIDDKSNESSNDKMFTSVTNLDLSSGTTYDIRVEFGGPASPFPSNANSMECELIVESVLL